MRKCIAAVLTAVIAVSQLTAAGEAKVKKRSVFFPAAAMNVYPIYRDDVLDPTILHDTANSKFRLSFVLPADYIKNTPVTIRLSMSSSTACNVFLGVQYFDRSRPGQNVYETSTPNHDGLSGGNTSVFTLPVQKNFLKTLKVTKPLNAPFTGQKPGDTIMFLFERLKTNPLDTCGFVYVQSAEMRYNAAY